jgi:hypothetical protein
MVSKRFRNSVGVKMLRTLRITPTERRGYTAGTDAAWAAREESGHTTGRNWPRKSFAATEGVGRGHEQAVCRGQSLTFTCLVSRL